MVTAGIISALGRNMQIDAPINSTEILTTAGSTSSASGAKSIAKSLGLDPNHPTGALGMQFLALDPQLREELHVPKEVNGVVVGQVASDSPAGELGIQQRDVIVSVDQKPVTTPEVAAAQLKEAAHGNVPLLINRHGTSPFVGLSVENNGTTDSSR